MQLTPFRLSIDLRGNSGPLQHALMLVGIDFLDHELERGHLLGGRFFEAGGRAAGQRQCSRQGSESGK
ncbi:hypothetical protein D3C84_1212580 [compost metagenome]